MSPPLDDVALIARDQDAATELFDVALGGDRARLYRVLEAKRTLSSYRLKLLNLETLYKLTGNPLDDWFKQPDYRAEDERFIRAGICRMQQIIATGGAS